MKLKLNEDGFIVKKLKRAIDRSFDDFMRSLRRIEFFTDEELMSLPAGSVFVFDVECYINFFYVAFKCVKTGKYVAFERSPDHDFNATKLRWMMWRFCIVGFNSTNYDVPIVELACAGYTCEQLKEATDYIIQSGIQYGTKKVTPYDVEKKYSIKIGRYNHIDLFNVCPVNGGVTARPASLKLYGGRLHCARMQDLPFPPDHVLTRQEAEIVRPYCCNDLDNTQLLYEELSPELKLRAEMSIEYDVELRSKSDAQVAEAVINSELEKILGYYPIAPIKDPRFKVPDFVQYVVPDFIQFQSKELNEIVASIAAAKFTLDSQGSPTWPAGLGEKEKTKDGKDKWVLKTKIGKSLYKLGMGGLHSSEKTVCHVAKNGIILADNDVESFYPRTILNLKLFPKHLGEAFLVVYEKIVSTRIHAKAMAAKCKDAGDKAGAKKWKVIADSLKITINGSFGKLGNKYSTLYAPQLMLQVTITGQLVLLMLIEALENIGIEVISGNTDGFISKYHKSRHKEVRDMIAKWEAHTSYKTEETQYLGVYSRDVNNYVAIKAAQDKKTKEWLNTPAVDPEARFIDEQLGCKTKGAYSERGSALNSVLSKNPETLVCTDAVLQYLINETPVEDTIRACRDFRRFTSVKTVHGGGEKNGKFLGKVVRFYFAEGEPGNIAYVSSGNKVPTTDGAKPAMDLPAEFPNDINYAWYEKEAIKMLHECGRLKKATTAPLFF